MRLPALFQEGKGGPWPGKQTVSIKTISEKTGLSTATVSRVINNKGGFSPETSERVQEAVRELGYVPNAMARGLRTKSIPLVGIIVPDIINEFFSRIVLYVSAGAGQPGLLGLHLQHRRVPRSTS